MRARQTHDRYASLTWLIIVMTMVVLVIGTIAARYVESRLVASKGESLALAASEIAHKLDLLLAERDSDVRTLAQNPLLREHNAAAQSAHLATVKKIHPIYLWLGVTDAGGRIVAATDPATIGKDLGGSSLFQAARDTGHVHVGDVEPFVEVGGTDAISFTAPIEGAGGEFQGVVTTRVGLPLLEDVVVRTIRTFQTPEESGGNLEYKFVTTSGAVFIDSDLIHKGNVNLKRMGLSSALLSESGQPGYFEEEHLQRHVPVVTGYARTQGAGEFPGLKWTVLLRTDKGDLVAPIRSVLWKLAAAWALVWLPMLGFSLWSAGRLKEEWTHAQDEHALAATAESKYRQLVDQARDIIYRADDQGRFTFVSPIVTRIMGYSPQELLGRRFIELLHPDARAAAERFYGGQFVRKTPSTYHEFPAIAKDGREVWIGQNVQAHLENGQVAGFHAVARDITERKRAEEVLRQSEEQFRSAFGHAAIGMALVSTDGRWLQVNPALCDIVGYSEPELLATTFQAITHPDDLDRDLAYVRQMLAGEIRYYQMEKRYLHKRGHPVWILLSVSLVRDAQGNPLHFIGLIQDITERKRAEEVLERLVAELAESRNRFEMFFRQTPSAISITTVKEGRFLDVNKQAEVLTGYPREELIGRTTVGMNLYVDPTDRPKLVQELKERGVITDLERLIRTKSGEIRTAVFSLVPIQIGSEPCLLSIAHDITERKRAEWRLRERSRQQAIEAELSLLAATVPDLSSLLDTAAKLASNALEADYCEVLELLPNGSELRLHASAGWKSDRIGQVRAAETGSLAHAALQSNKPVIQALPDNARFGGPPWLHEHGAVGGMNVSIPGKERPWGVLGVYTAGERAFSHDDVNFLQTVSSILATAIERMQAESVLKGANQALRLLSRQLLQVQEDDRRAIARDLHDEIGQSLTAIKLNVERAQRTSDRDARTRIMQDCAQITERVLGQVRDLSLDLHPSILDDLGLAYALRWYADRQAERAGLKVEVTADPSLPRLPQDIEIACFRIAQEALTNVVRHARANQAGIALKRLAKRVELRIQDDGIGFDVKTVQSPMGGGTSIGLTGMRERARLVGGEVHVTSDPQKGTIITAIVPLPSVPSADTTTPQAPPS